MIFKTESLVHDNSVFSIVDTSLLAHCTDMYAPQDVDPNKLESTTLNDNIDDVTT